MGSNPLTLTLSAPGRGNPSVPASRLCLTIRFVFLLVFCAPALAFFAPAFARERLQIVATTTDLRSLTEAVGGDRVAVVSMVPPNLDPEEYQPRPQDLARLKGARMAVRVGLDFDIWFDRLLVQAGGGIQRGAPGYVDASFAITPLEVRGATVGPGDGHAHGSGNPHYWLDPKNAEIITANILEGLVRVDPENAPLYEANRRAFVEKLNGKILAWEAVTAALEGVPFVAYHNSWAYFARRFRLDIIGFVEPKPGVSPSPFHVASLISLMQQRNARIIIRQPHEPERDVAFLAKRTNSQIVVLASSVGATKNAQDYLSLFDDNNPGHIAAAAKARRR
jgi:ABC-type Zn uptake system ZnuABC Zn-binding protein ZnuA